MFHFHPLPEALLPDLQSPWRRTQEKRGGVFRGEQKHYLSADMDIVLLKFNTWPL